MAKKSKRKLSRWQLHVKNYMARHPGLSFKEALPKAKLTYGAKRKGGGSNPRPAVLKPKRRGYLKRMAKKNKNRRRSFTIPLGPTGGVLGTLLGGSNVGPEHTTIGHLARGDGYGAGTRVIANVTGYNIQTGKFNWKEINILPAVVGTFIHIGANLLGINRFLARSRVPIVRI